MRVTRILIEKRNLFRGLVKLSKDTNINMIKLVHISHSRYKKIKLTDALKISKSLDISLSQLVDIQFDILNTYRM
ncbi:hypothetical protein A7W90_16300 [Clostridium sp. Bc-iso-3]|nr:hypothetical protein A7W90_16300 [Clostridium sp. Bc-iso-3]